MKKELILHIGTAKTGSSAIQAALGQNQSFLLENKILYPNLTGSGFGQYLERGLLAGNADPDWESFSWEGNSGIDRIAYLIDSTMKTDLDIEQFVLSGERMSIYAQNEAFWELLALKSYAWDTLFNVVVYLREPFSYFVSCYKQQVKQGHFWGNLDQFVERFLNDVNFATTFTFYKSMPKILDMADKKGIMFTVFQYEEHLSKIDHHFFSSVLHIDPGVMNSNQQKINSSINMWEVEFHRGVASVSPQMAFSLGLEKSDLHLAQFRKKVEGSNQVSLNKSSTKKLEREFLRYKKSIDGLIPFSQEIDSRVHGKLSDSLSHHELLTRNQIYEIGRFVAMSHEYGYLDLENRRKP